LLFDLGLGSTSKSQFETLLEAVTAQKKHFFVGINF
jgi:hypothetical protein